MSMRMAMHAYGTCVCQSCPGASCKMVRQDEQAHAHRVASAKVSQFQCCGPYACVSHLSGHSDEIAVGASARE